VTFRSFKVPQNGTGLSGVHEGMDHTPAVDVAKPSWVEARFEDFFLGTYARLARGLLLLTGDPAEAEDVAQEAESRVLERWERVRSMESPEGYLYRTALNISRHRLRRLTVRAKPLPARIPADPLAIAELRLDLLMRIAALPQAQREALVLVHWAGMTAEEAGQILQVDPTSVRTRLHRARQALREAMGEDHE
jgi:RNA polymerase sigma-70 factor, ECF subfamily